MIFSKKKFLASDSGRRYRRQLAEHLDCIDGVAVEWEEKDQFGRAEYTVDGNVWLLYPVLPEWCDTEECLK